MEPITKEINIPESIQKSWGKIEDDMALRWFPKERNDDLDKSFWHASQD